MTIVNQIASKLSNPRVFIPVASVAAGIALTYQLLASRPAIANESGKVFKGDNEWVDLKVKKTWDVSSNTKHLIFEFPNKDDVSGLITASCLLTKFVTEKGNNVIRPYTPISDNDDKGEIEFVIKKYEGGKASTHIHSLKEGDTLSFKGPIVKWKWEPNQYKEIFLIGGGTGITPLYQLIHEITKNPSDKTKVSLFYGSLSPKDILLKKQLDDISSKHKDQVNLVYFVDKAEGSFDGIVGHISKEYLQKNLPSPSKDLKIFVCGPPGMAKAISGAKVSPTDQGEVTGALADLGFTKEHVYKL